MYMVKQNSTMLVVVLMLHYSASAANARTWQDGQEGSVERLGSVMKYRYFLPADYDATQEYPLVLFLHGSGAVGTDNVQQVSRSIGNLIRKTESEFPAILIAPQLPMRRLWSVINQQDLTTKVLEEVLSDYSVDLDRLYLTGLSLGGFGVTNYLQIFNGINPDILQFAAAAPIAGSLIGDTLAPMLQETPIWIAHGDQDTVIDVSFSRGTFNVLAGKERDALIDFPPSSFGAGGPLAIAGSVRYTEYPGVGHNSWSQFYASQDVYEWLFAQSLGAPVPEPSSALLLLLAGLLTSSFLRRPRRS